MGEKCIMLPMNAENRFEILRKRSEITEAVRNFFIDRGYLQVSTPVLAPHVIPEAHIEIFRTELISPYEDPKNLYLLPSPELWMKKLISEGSGSIFQICKSFRNYEQNGRNHSPEFTMLEWYTVEADYKHSLALTKELLAMLFSRFRPEYSTLPVNVISVREAFLRTTGIDIALCPDFGSIKSAALEKGYEIGDDYTTWEEVFNKLFILETEPAVCGSGITVLIDYPAQIPSLAKLNKENFTYERWEIYMDGIEIANCYSEERRVDVVKDFYISEGNVKDEIAAVKVDVDYSYPEIFRTFPECSGTALGMDRLVMILTGCRDIRNVL